MHDSIIRNQRGNSPEFEWVYMYDKTMMKDYTITSLWNSRELRSKAAKHRKNNFWEKWLGKGDLSFHLNWSAVVMPHKSKAFFNVSFNCRHGPMWTWEMQRHACKATTEHIAFMWCHYRNAVEMKCSRDCSHHAWSLFLRKFIVFKNCKVMILIMFLDGGNSWNTMLHKLNKFIHWNYDLILHHFFYK